MNTGMLSFTKKSLLDRAILCSPEIIGFNAQVESNTQMNKRRLWNVIDVTITFWQSETYQYLRYFEVSQWTVFHNGDRQLWKELHFHSPKLWVHAKATVWLSISRIANAALGRGSKVNFSTKPNPDKSKYNNIVSLVKNVCLFFYSYFLDKNTYLTEQ